MDQAVAMLHPDAEKIAGITATDIVKEMGYFSRGAHAAGGGELRNDARLGKMRVVNVRGGDLNVDLGVIGKSHDAKLVVLRGLRGEIIVEPGTVIVPDLTDMDALAAGDILRGLSLNIRRGEVRSSADFVAGSIVSQDPAAGRQVRPGSTVTVVLSEGPSAVVVPDVTDMSLAQARRNLEAAGIARGKVTEVYDTNVSAGYVVSTLPGAGTKVMSGIAVDLIVTIGEDAQRGNPTRMRESAP